jgi:hypothetical protein
MPINMPIGAKHGKFMDEVKLIPRRPFSGSNHSDGICMPMPYSTMVGY